MWCHKIKDPSRPCHISLTPLPPLTCDVIYGCPQRENRKFKRVQIHGSHNNKCWNPELEINEKISTRGYATLILKCVFCDENVATQEKKTTSSYSIIKTTA